MRRSCLSLVIPCSLLLAACSRTTPEGGEAGAKVEAGARSYEVVTIDRPESVTDYHRMQKATYDMCAAVRTLQKLPVKPFVTLPADFISARKTHVSDGKAYLFKEERFDVEVEGPEQGCASRVQPSWSTYLGRDGKMYYAGTDENGKRTTSPPDEFEAPREAKDEHFTEPRTIKGIAVKCMPVLPEMQKMLSDLCVADLKPGTLIDSSGEPITLYSKVGIVKDLQSVIVTEPVTVRVGGKVDQALFDAAAAP